MHWGEPQVARAVRGVAGVAPSPQQRPGVTFFAAEQQEDFAEVPQQDLAASGVSVWVGTGHPHAFTDTGTAPTSAANTVSTQSTSRAARRIGIGSSYAGAGHPVNIGMGGARGPACLTRRALTRQIYTISGRG